MHVLTASHDRTAKLWDLGGKLLVIFHHNNLAEKSIFDRGVESAVFSLDGVQVLTGSLDKSVLWNLDGKQLETFHHENSGYMSPEHWFFYTRDKENQKCLDLSDGIVTLYDSHGSVLSIFPNYKWEGPHCNYDGEYSGVLSPDGANFLTANAAKLYNSDGVAKLLELHPLWNSSKYRNGKLSLQELAVVLLILKHGDFIQSNTYVQDVVIEVLNQIDGPVDGEVVVPDEQRHIKNFFLTFLD
jgi:WD40 repeat protein